MAYVPGHGPPAMAMAIAMVHGPWQWRMGHGPWPMAHGPYGHDRLGQVVPWPGSHTDRMDMARPVYDSSRVLPPRSELPIYWQPMGHGPWVMAMGHGGFERKNNFKVISEMCKYR